MTKSVENIVPHLWFDKEANEAADFYTSIFPNSKVTSLTTLKDTPSGDSHLVAFELWGQRFMAISAGPYFKFNPSISFTVHFNQSQEKGASEQIDKVWNQLSEGGTVLMPLTNYPFSEKYGWIQDKYGLSWQLMLTDSKGEERPTIARSLMFVGDTCGKAEEAIDFYLSIFKNSKLGNLARYPEKSDPNEKGTVMFSDFTLENQRFTAMDSAIDHSFHFSEAISFMVYCDTQDEIDYYWNKLSAVPESEQCGWLKDKFGVSWQIVPREMIKMMSDTNTPEQIARLNKETLKMKKLDLSKLQEAFKG